MSTNMRTCLLCDVNVDYSGALEHSFGLYHSDYELIEWVLSHTCGRKALRSP